MFETKGILFVVLDIVCLVLAGLPFLILTPRNSPYKRGFFCDDDSIKYPHKEDTISYQLLGGIMIPFVLLSLVLGECLSVYFKRITSKSSIRNNYVACVYKAVGTFVFGAAMNQSLTDIAKFTIGRLRPHFLDACKPVWDQIDCKSGGYIENFTCTGDSAMVTEARLSFYSGHSSFSMYCMVFLTLYYQTRLKTEWARLLLPTIHDVLVGLIQGAIIAILIVTCVTDFFKKPVAAHKEEEVDMPQSCLQESPTNGNHYGSTR
ncbi:hypothetical protein ANANG_G00199050 [Anguilla anguilla]|uniref:Phospholipid phosphatase 1 n=1 Tax=Anguilla anguilla TaxID=7936 RepID=A0A9D3RS68_ANGAN|nr:hypothetical protein ANANG_G00199050 [Anguilla anguilla]